MSNDTNHDLFLEYAVELLDMTPEKAHQMKEKVDGFIQVLCTKYADFSNNNPEQSEQLKTDIQLINNNLNIAEKCMFLERWKQLQAHYYAKFPVM